MSANIGSLSPWHLASISMQDTPYLGMLSMAWTYVTGWPKSPSTVTIRRSPRLSWHIAANWSGNRGPIEPLKARSKRPIGDTGLCKRMERKKPNVAVREAILRNHRLNRGPHPDAAEIANDPHRAVEEIIRDLTKIDVVAPLPDHCLEMITPHNRHRGNVSIADAARLHRALGPRSDQGRPV